MSALLSVVGPSAKAELRRTAFSTSRTAPVPPVPRDLSKRIREAFEVDAAQSWDEALGSLARASLKGSP